jgi:hypothetical protein
MSSFLSTAYSDTEIQNQFNPNLAMKALSIRQGRYDANKAQVEQTLSVYKNQLKGLRDSDNEYIAASLKQVESVINGYGNKDYSLTSTKDTLLGNLRNVTEDPIIRSAILNRAKYDQYNKVAEENKKSGKGTYNDGNYDFGLYKSGYYSYMKGETKNLGNLEYQNYTDVDKKMSDKIAELEKLNKDRVIQEQVLDVNGNPTGQMRETTVSNLSPEKVRQIAVNSLDVNDLKQIEINGYVSTGRYADPVKIAADITTAYDSQIKNNKEQLDIWEAKNNQDNLSEKDKKEAKTQFDYYDNAVTSLTKNKSILLGNKEAAATYLEQNKLIDNAVSIYSTVYNQSSVYKVDEIYQNKIENSRADARLRLEYDKFDYTKKKDSGQLEAENLIVSPKAAPKDDIENLEGEIDKQINTYSEVLNTETAEYKIRIDNLLKADPTNKDAKAWNSLYSKNKAKGQNDVDAIRNAMQMTNGDSSVIVLNDANGVPKNYRRSILNVSGKYDTYTIGRSEAIEKGTAEHVEATLNNQETFSAFFNNPNTKMTWYKNGKPSSAPVKDVLISKGIMDRNGNKIGSITDHPDVLKELQRSYAADSILSNKGIGGFVQDQKLKELARTFNEDVSTVSKLRRYQVRTQDGVQDRVTYDVNPNTRTGQYLLNADKEGIKDTLSWSDQSLSGDDSTIGRYVNTDYKSSNSYKNQIKNLYGKTDSNFSVGVTSADKTTHQRLRSLLSSDAVTTATGQINPDNTFNISINNDGNTVTIQQYDADKKTGTTSFETTIDRSTFENNVPQVANKLNLSINQAHYTVGRTKPLDLISNKIQFFTSQTDEQVYLENVNSLRVLGDKALKSFVPYLTQEDAISTITNKLTPAFGQNSEESKVAIAAIQNSSDFSIVGNIGTDFDNTNYLTLALKNAKGDTIYKKNVKGIKDVDTYKDILDNSPQIYFADMVDEIMNSQKTYKMNNGTNSPAYNTLVKNLQ